MGVFLFHFCFVSDWGFLKDIQYKKFEITSIFVLTVICHTESPVTEMTRLVSEVSLFVIGQELFNLKMLA